MRLGKSQRDERDTQLIPPLEGDDTVAAGAGEGWPDFAGPGDPTTAEPGGAPSRARPPVRVAVLLALLIGTTAAGVLLGRAIDPPAAKVKAPHAVPPTPAPVKKKPVVRPHWGPLAAVPFGRLTPTGGVAAAFGSGDRLFVIGAGRHPPIFNGRAGTALPQVTQLPHSIAAAAAFPAGSVFVVGGEQASKPTDEILELRLGVRQLVTGLRFTEPLAESGVVPQPGFVYLVGGWTGEKYATAVLRFTPPAGSTVVARLPEGVRSPAVALVGAVLYVAGGRMQSGPSRNVYSVDTKTGAVKTVARLPHAVDRALLVASGPELYLLGGRAANGRRLDTIVRIDPRTGRAAAAGRMPFALAGGAAVPFGKSTIVIGAASGLIYRVGSAAAVTGRPGSAKGA